MRHDTWRVFLDHPATGTGLGTLPTVFPAYETLYDGKFVNHAHNDYLEALADTGLVGGVCCAAFLGMLAFFSLRQLLQSDKQLDVDSVTNGNEALAALTKQYYSILITDLRMPELDGIRLIEEIQKLHLPVTVAPFTGS